MALDRDTIITTLWPNVERKRRARLRRKVIAA